MAILSVLWGKQWSLRDAREAEAMTIIRAEDKLQRVGGGSVRDVTMALTRNHIKYEFSSYSVSGISADGRIAVVREHYDDRDTVVEDIFVGCQAYALAPLTCIFTRSDFFAWATPDDSSVIENLDGGDKFLQYRITHGAICGAVFSSYHNGISRAQIVRLCKPPTVNNIEYVQFFCNNEHYMAYGPTNRDHARATQLRIVLIRNHVMTLTIYRRCDHRAKVSDDVACGDFDCQSD